MSVTYPRHIVERDPVTDEVTYEFTQDIYDSGSNPLVYATSATDYDVEGEQPWTSYSITQKHYGTQGSVALTSVEAIMDDGSKVHADFEYGFVSGGDPIGYRNLWSSYDAEGRLTGAVVDYVRSGAVGYGLPRPDYFHLETSYDPVTGHADYSYAIKATGQEVSIDYDAATGLFDYVYAVDPNGHSLSQDYTGGLLDYQIERMADGRMIVTDFDLLDAQTWASYSIAYSAAGAIESVTVL